MVELLFYSDYDQNKGRYVATHVGCADDGRGTIMLATFEFICHLLITAHEGSQMLDGKPITFTERDNGRCIDTLTLGHYVLKQTERSIHAHFERPALALVRERGWEVLRLDVGREPHMEFEVGWAGNDVTDD